MKKLKQLTREEKQRLSFFKYKAITVMQPFASMFIRKDDPKTIEVRSKRTNYRGDIVITSSKNPQVGSLPNGVAICIAELYDCRDFHENDFKQSKWKPQLHDDNNYYSWYLRNIRIIEPFEIRDNLGIWNLYTNLPIKVKGFNLKNKINDILRRLSD